LICLYNYVFEAFGYGLLAFWMDYDDQIIFFLTRLYIFVVLFSSYMTNLNFLSRYRWYFIVLCFVLSSLDVCAQGIDQSNPSPIKFPVPKGISNQLFYLQRDPNPNTIICQLNMDKNGVVNREEPILVYWIRYGEEGKQQDLSYIQRKFAYGIQTKELAKDRYELRFVSHKKLPMYLQKGDDKKFHVYVTLNQKKIQVERIFVRIEGGSFWLPNVKYVEIKGLDVGKAEAVTERIKV